MKVTIPAVAPDATTGWRLGYPGLLPHGAFMRRGDGAGLVVAHITGPTVWTMNYADEAENPWIDFAGAEPVLLDTAK